MLSRAWWSVHTSPSFSIYLNLSPMCRTIPGPSGSFSSRFQPSSVSSPHTQCSLPFLPSPRVHQALWVLESRTGSWEAATATALSPTEGVREWASVSPPIPIVEASQHGHMALRFIIYINVIRVEGKDTQHELTLVHTLPFDTSLFLHSTHSSLP